MKSLHLTFTNSQFTLNSHFSFTNSAAVIGRNCKMLNDNLSGLRSQSYFGGVGLKIVKCKLIISTTKGVA
jgi:hypothetical protein